MMKDVAHDRGTRSAPDPEPAYAPERSGTPPTWSVAPAARKTPLGPHYACLECFGPLEVGYAFGTVTRKQIESGPRSIWRYAPLLPVPADIATFRSTDPGFTRLVDARHLADDLGLRRCG